MYKYITLCSSFFNKCIYFTFNSLIDIIKTKHKKDLI